MNRFKTWLRSKIADRDQRLNPGRTTMQFNGQTYILTMASHYNRGESVHLEFARLDLYEERLRRG